MSNNKSKNGRKINHVNETNSLLSGNEYTSLYSQREYSNYYFGVNIFDLYSQEELAALVKEPIKNNKILREISLILYGTNGTYTNTVDYMTAIPTLDKVIITHGKNKNKKRQNKELMESALRTIKDKEIIRDALWRGMIDGVAFYYFEVTGSGAYMDKMLSDYDVNNVVEINELGINASIISLPANYTEIVGIKNNSFVIAFNLDFFNNNIGESVERKLKKFPKEIRDAYYARYNGNNFNGKNWVVLDNKKTIVHKIRSSRSEKYGRPIVLAAISDILYDDYFKRTKRNVLGEINNKIIYQTLPEGQNKGTCALTKAQQASQHEKVKEAVLKKNNRGGTSFFTVSAGTKINELNVNNSDIFDSKYESNLSDRIALDMGISGSLLNGVGSGSYSAQQQNLELLTAQLFQWIEQISLELNKCISENLINDPRNWVECKYLPMTYVNRESMIKNAKELYLQGCGSLSLWSAACGVSPDTFFALIDQEMDSGIYEKYKPHPTSYTLSSKDSDFDFCKNSGRPKTDNPTDKTIQSRANNGNNIPSPSDKK